ncbi:MAG: DUF1648 domain-containing protein [Solibacillus sp.]|jgi:uncharacterized membrane protein|uniref:DUF1648 domain-containing protein n=1 Tax=unclassified Solibacillus TaxID=2637870 RepID=UPI0030F62AFD
MNEYNRPKLHIAKTKSEWLADTIGYVALACLFSILLFNWSGLPEQVPAHYGANGEVDRWGSKYELFILPVIATFMQFFLMIFEKNPETHNYPARINESNARDFYLNSRQLLNYTKNIINILFAYIVWKTVEIASGADATLGWPFYVILGLLIGVTTWKVVKTFKIK